MLQLKQLNSDNRAEWLVEKRYTFGTGPENHYRVDGEGVIDVHAGLEVNDDQIQLFNFGESNTVQVNGAELVKKQTLQPGDEFSIGNNSFKLEDPKQTHKPEKIVSADLVDWTLKAKNTALANKSFPLKGVHTIGRAKECDICLNVVHLSRRHAKITVKEKHLLIEDLKSSNGTFVNGRRIESAQIKSGDEIGFDTLKFSVIGPVAALDKTHIRKDALDSDATTMRPMINPSELAELAKNKPTTKVAKPNQTTQTKAPQNQNKMNEIEVVQDQQTGKILFAVILVLIALAAVYILLA